MRRLLLAPLVLACLVFASAAEAHTPSCAHPSYHHGEVLPLELKAFILDNEWYVEAHNAPVGCYYILFESVNGAVPIWHLKSPTAINPDIAPGEVICYRLAQTDDEDLPVGVWRWSNEVCVEGFEGERS